MGSQAGNLPRTVILASHDVHRVPAALDRLAAVLGRARRRPRTARVPLASFFPLCVQQFDVELCSLQEVSSDLFQEPLLNAESIHS